MQEPPAIAFEDVCVDFNGQAVLTRVSFAIRPHEFLAVVGASGSGKTTLLRLINRLSEPSEGRVSIDGEDVRKVDPIRLRRSIGYVFQGVGLFPHMNVAENIAVTARLIGWDRDRRHQRVAELLQVVHLDQAYAERFPHQLSGGERQRVGVARALAAKPRIMLMDEPFSALDSITRDALGADYRRLHDELALTTVMITHDMLEALLLADRIIVLQDGKLIADAPPASMVTHDHGYVRELMNTPRRQAERLRAFMATSEAR
jgi:osmoprotectant transport system ATP-binding protein